MNTAYERILDRLRDQGKKVRQSGAHATAQCPSHDDRQASLAIYNKPGKAKVVCFAGCNDALDILPALDMDAAGLHDDYGTDPRTADEPDPQLQAHIEARAKHDTSTARAG